jgi:hypothetical protein
MAAHMFILYFGMLSVVTPPIAVAAFAAATISKASQWSTGWAAMRIGWTAFVIPFMFVLSPTLLMYGHPLWVIFDCVTAWIGVYYVTAGVVGWYQRNMTIVERLALGVGGILAVVPDSTKLAVLFPGFISLLGVAIGAVILLPLWIKSRPPITAASIGRALVSPRVLMALVGIIVFGAIAYVFRTAVPGLGKPGLMEVITFGAGVTSKDLATAAQNAFSMMLMAAAGGAIVGYIMGNFLSGRSAKTAPASAQ